MVTIEKIEGTSVYTLELDDEISDSESQKIKDFFSEASEREDEINLLAKIPTIPGLENIQALWDLIISEINALQTVKRYAVITENEWIVKIEKIEDYLISSIPFKIFEPGEKDKAIKWLSKVNRDSIDPGDYFSEIDIDKVPGTEIYEFTVDGEIDEAGMKALHNILNNQPPESKILLLGTLKNVKSIESLKTIIEGVKVDVKAINKVGKYAYLIDYDMLKGIGSITDRFIPNIEIKGFELDERDEAIKWLLSHK